MQSKGLENMMFPSRNKMPRIPGTLTLEIIEYARIVGKDSLLKYAWDHEETVSMLIWRRNLERSHKRQFIEGCLGPWGDCVYVNLETKS